MHQILYKIILWLGIYIFVYFQGIFSIQIAHWTGDDQTSLPCIFYTAVWQTLPIFMCMLDYISRREHESRTILLEGAQNPEYFWRIDSITICGIVLGSFLAQTVGFALYIGIFEKYIRDGRYACDFGIAIVRFTNGIFGGFVGWVMLIVYEHFCR